MAEGRLGRSRVPQKYSFLHSDEWRSHEQSKIKDKKIKVIRIEVEREGPSCPAVPVAAPSFYPQQGFVLKRGRYLFRVTSFHSPIKMELEFVDGFSLKDLKDQDYGQPCFWNRMQTFYQSQYIQNRYRLIHQPNEGSVYVYYDGSSWDRVELCERTPELQTVKVAYVDKGVPDDFIWTSYGSLYNLAPPFLYPPFKGFIATFAGIEMNNEIDFEAMTENLKKELEGKVVCAKVMDKWHIRPRTSVTPKYYSTFLTAIFHILTGEEGGLPAKSVQDEMIARGWAKETWSAELVRTCVEALTDPSGSEESWLYE